MGLRVLRVAPEILAQAVALLPPGLIVGSVPSDGSIGLLLSAHWWDEHPNADDPAQPVPEVFADMCVDVSGGKLWSKMRIAERA